MTDKRGTGDELGRIKVNDELEIIFEDDGCHDKDTMVFITHDDCRYQVDSLLRFESRSDDEQFMKDIENAGGDTYHNILLS